MTVSPVGPYYYYYYYYYSKVFIYCVTWLFSGLCQMEDTSRFTWKHNHLLVKIYNTIHAVLVPLLGTLFQTISQPAHSLTMCL